MPDPAFMQLRFDDRELTLWNGTAAVPAAPKVLHLLRALLARPGRLASREDLLAAVWPNEHVTPDALRYSMRQLRIALSDSATTPAFIETVPRRGWRFIGQASLGADSTWQLAPHDAALSPARPARVLRPVMGRTHELERLRQALARAHGGERQLVFVSGEPGIGKTTLVETFLNPLEYETETQVARGQCVEDMGAGEAYLPIFELLERLCTAPGISRATETLRQYAPTWLAQMPALSDPDEREALRLQTQGSTQGRMIRELALAIEAMSVDQTLVLWIDDLHWTDVSTLEFLARCMRRPEPARLLLIASHRPMEGHAAAAAFDTIHQELSLHSACEDIDVPFLGADAIAEYNEAELGPAASEKDATRLRDFVAERSHGHPLFMTSLVEELLRTDVIARREDAWHLKGDLDAASVPKTIERLLAQGLDGIDADERAILEVCSVAGMYASTASIAAATDAPLEQIERALEALAARRRYIVGRSFERWPDGTRSNGYEFIHALHRDLFGAMVPAARQTRWLQAIAERKAAAWGDRSPEIATELARHFAAAGDAAQASRFFAISGDSAASVSANDEAVGQLEKALLWTERVPASPERNGQELMIRLALSPPLASTEGYATTRIARNLRRIEELIEATGAVDSLHPVLLGLWSLYIVRGELAEAAEIGQRLLRHAAADDSDPIGTLQANRTLGFCRFFSGDLEVADRLLEAGHRLVDIKTHPRLDYSVGDDPVVLVLSYQAWVAWFRGDPDRAGRLAEEAVAVGRRIEHPPSLAFALAFAGVTHHLRRDVDAARSSANALLDVADGDGMAMWSALARILRGWAEGFSAAGGDQGLEEMRDGLARWESTGAELGRPYFLCMVTDALLRAGQATDAADLLDLAADCIQQTQQDLFRPEVERLRGELSLQCKNNAAARAHFTRAIQMARAVEATGLELRTALSWAEADPSSQGAYDSIRTALDRCTAANDDREQGRALALLATRT